MRKKFNRTWRIVLMVLVVLVALRLALPFFVTRHINAVLNNLPEYRGMVKDVDVHLLRGAYVIKELKIYPANNQDTIPFLNVPQIEVSIDWDAVSDGALVGELQFERPQLTFVAGDKKLTHYGAIDWTGLIHKLLPLDINHIRIHNGKLAFQDLNTQPEINMFLNNVQIDAQNLDNAKDNPEELPSRLFLQAGSIGNGQLSMIIRMNVLKPTPDLDLDLKFENMNLQAIQHFFQEYAHANVEKGMFNLYSEVAVLNGRITGYVKPVFNNIKVLRNTTLQEEPVVVWGSVASNLTKVSGNAYKNRFISQVPMEGEMGNEQTTFWPALWNIFRNTFAQAFETKSTYAFAQDTDKLAENKKETVQPQKDKKDIRKEKRRERREKRKEKKREKKELEINKADKRTAKDNSLPL